MKLLNTLLKSGLVIVVCMLSVQTTIAQSSVLNNISPDFNVSQMSDAQMLQLWQEAQQNGLSESQAIKLMSRKGMNATQISAFKKRLLDMQNNNSKINKSNELTLVTDTAAFMRDSSWIAEIPQARKKSKIYGMDFFANPNPSFEPNLRIATPADYVIGPDDMLVVSVTGFNENTFNKKVTPEGTIQIPYAGIVNVAGLTIEQAGKVIKNKLQKVYPGLTSGRTHLALTLGSVKTIGVTIIGEAQRPGKYSVSSLASFFNVMYLSGGPTENGSLRNIEIIRNNKIIATVDLYSFLQKGIFNKDIKLEDQDVIRIPVYSKHVCLSGEIKRPAVYELQSKETLDDLIRLGGGFGDTAYKNSVKVFQLTDREKKIKDIAADDFNYYIPHNGDSVFIDRKMIDVTMNKVSITGAVNHPGMYELSDNLTLLQLVSKADSLRERAATKRVVIKRLDNENNRILIAADLSAIMQHQTGDVFLAKEDSVYIPFIDDIQDVEGVSVSGFVRHPGKFIYREGMTAADAVLMAGGFNADAATHRVEISRTNKNKSDTLANKLVDIIRIDLDSTDAVNNENFLLKPLDNVFVPRLLNYHSLGSVEIKGEVLFPGDYQIERRDETVKDLIQRAGGLTTFGALENVQVYRRNLRVGVDLLHDKENKDFLLQASDSIYIPKTQSYVEVTGGVFNPQIVAYDSRKFSSYISAAGGVNEKGRLGKAYIQYSNGINRKTKHFLFFRNYPKVLPGSKIIVPEDTSFRTRLLDNTTGLTTILTALTALVTIAKLL